MVAVASISSLRTHAQVIANGGHWVSIRAVCVKDLFPWLTAKLRGCAHYCMPASISCHIVLSGKNGSAAVVGLAVSLLSPHWYPESFQSNKTHQPHKSKHIPKNSSPLQVWLMKCSTSKKVGPNLFKVYCIHQTTAWKVFLFAGLHNGEKP